MVITVLSEDATYRLVSSTLLICQSHYVNEKGRKEICQRP